MAVIAPAVEREMAFYETKTIAYVFEAVCLFYYWKEVGVLEEELAEV